MQVAKWGNSLAVRLPASIVKALDLKVGDKIDIAAAGDRTFEISRQPGRRELAERLRAFEGMIPADTGFDRDEANGQ